MISPFLQSSDDDQPRNLDSMSKFGKYFARFGLYATVSTPGSRGQWTGQGGIHVAFGADTMGWLDVDQLAFIADKLGVPDHKIGDHLHAFGGRLHDNPPYHYTMTFEWQNDVK